MALNAPAFSATFVNAASSSQEEQSAYGLRRRLALLARVQTHWPETAGSYAVAPSSQRHVQVFAGRLASLVSRSRLHDVKAFLIPTIRKVLDRFPSAGIYLMACLRRKQLSSELCKAITPSNKSLPGTTVNFVNPSCSPWLS